MPSLHIMDMENSHVDGSLNGIFVKQEPEEFDEENSDCAPLGQGFLSELKYVEVEIDCKEKIRDKIKGRRGRPPKKKVGRPRSGKTHSREERRLYRLRLKHAKMYGRTKNADKHSDAHKKRAKDNAKKMVPESKSPTRLSRAAKLKCLQNFPKIFEEERVYNLMVLRERAAKRAAEERREERKHVPEATATIEIMYRL